MAGEERITQPFDPSLIRVETRPMTIDLLVVRMREKELDLGTGFQRKTGAWKEDTQSRLIEQVKSRVGYRFEKTVYTIVVLTGVSKPKNPNVDFSIAISDFCPINERGKKIEVYGHRLVFLNPWLRNEQTPKNVNAWLELIEDSLDEQVDESRYRASPIFQKVIDEIKTDRIAPDELSKIKDEAAWEDVLRAEREEARQEQKREIALSMLQAGISVDLISKTTGLQPEDIEALRKSTFGTTE
ncbi:MAG: hypothetical protein ACE5PV_04780 [Candidatus Poribacteria bacterium]